MSEHQRLISNTYRNVALDTSMIISDKIRITGSERKIFEPLRLPSDLPPCSTFNAQRTSAKILWWCPPCIWGDLAKRRKMEPQSLQDRKIQFWTHRAQEYTGPITRSEGQRGQRNKELFHLFFYIWCRICVHHVVIVLVPKQVNWQGSHHSLWHFQNADNFGWYFSVENVTENDIPPRNFLILTNCIF